jgi:hypothetical protein
VNEYPCLFPESRLPELKEGAIGDLLVSADAFVDEKVVFEYTQERKEEFLPAGTVLVAQINPEKVPHSLKDEIKSCMPGYMGAAAFVEAVAQGTSAGTEAVAEAALLDKLVGTVLALVHGKVFKGGVAGL